MTDYKFTPDEIPSMSNFNKRFEGLNTLNANLYSHYWNKYEIRFEDFADGSTTDKVAINPPIRLLTDKQPAPSIVDGKFDFRGATTYSPRSGNSVDLYNGYKFTTGEEKADTYYEATGSGDIYNNNKWYVISPAAKIHRIKSTIGALVGVVKSDNPNAYPKSGFSGGYYYEYLGSPFENAQIAAKIDKGSYTGTGTYGENNPCSLTFDFIPKYIAIYYIGSDYGTNPIKTELMQGMYGVFNENSVFGVKYYAGNNANVGVISEWGTTVKFYANSLTYQPNKQGVTYKYLAIG